MNNEIKFKYLSSSIILTSHIRRYTLRSMEKFSRCLFSVIAIGGVLFLTCGVVQSKNVEYVHESASWEIERIELSVPPDVFQGWRFESAELVLERVKGAKADEATLTANRAHGFGFIFHDFDLLAKDMVLDAEKLLQGIPKLIGIGSVQASGYISEEDFLDYMRDKFGLDSEEVKISSEGIRLSGLKFGIPWMVQLSIYFDHDHQELHFKTENLEVWSFPIPLFPYGLLSKKIHLEAPKNSLVSLKIHSIKLQKNRIQFLVQSETSMEN